jgi:hypothetical protein
MTSPDAPLNDDELKFLQAVTGGNFKQSEFYQEVDNANVTVIADNVRAAGTPLCCAYIEEEVPGHPPRLMVYYFLEDQDFWSLIGEGVDVYFPRPSFKLIPPTTDESNMSLEESAPRKSAWNEALIEALASEATFALIAKLRGQRP